MSVATDTLVTVEELLEAVSFMWSIPRLYSEGHQERLVSDSEWTVMVRRPGAVVESRRLKTGAI
jgi:hypothetical protein